MFDYRLAIFQLLETLHFVLLFLQEDQNAHMGIFVRIAFQTFLFLTVPVKDIE